MPSRFDYLSEVELQHLYAAICSSPLKGKQPTASLDVEIAQALGRAGGGDGRTPPRPSLQEILAAVERIETILGYGVCSYGRYD